MKASGLFKQKQVTRRMIICIPWCKLHNYISGECMDCRLQNYFFW